MPTNSFPALWGLLFVAILGHSACWAQSCFNYLLKDTPKIRSELKPEEQNIQLHRPGEYNPQTFNSLGENVSLATNYLHPEKANFAPVQNVADFKFALRKTVPIRELIAADLFRGPSPADQAKRKLISIFQKSESTPMTIVMEVTPESAFAPPHRRLGWRCPFIYHSPLPTIHRRLNKLMFSNLSQVQNRRLFSSLLIIIL